MTFILLALFLLDGQTASPVALTGLLTDAVPILELRTHLQGGFSSPETLRKKTTIPEF